LASERGLADNSLHAYRRDLEGMDDHFRAAGKTLLTADPTDFREYLQSQSRIGKATKPVARRLAAIRVFLRFLASTGRDSTAILQQLERPQPNAPAPGLPVRAAGGLRRPPRRGLGGGRRSAALGLNSPRAHERGLIPKQVSPTTPAFPGVVFHFTVRHTLSGTHARPMPPRRTT